MPRGTYLHLYKPTAVITESNDASVSGICLTSEEDRRPAFEQMRCLRIKCP